MTTPNQSWCDAPECPVLAEGDVHVWRASLSQHRARLLELWQSLSTDERERARRFHFDRDREHFVAARGALRNILCRYTGTAPGLLRFSYDGYGKPGLSEAAGGRLRFNVSHSNGLALYAVTAGREVGIDIESVREDFASLEVAARFFSAQEVSALRFPPARGAGERFLRLLGAQGGVYQSPRRRALSPATPFHRVAQSRRAGRTPAHRGRPAGSDPLVSARAVGRRGLPCRHRGRGHAAVAELLALGLKRSRASTGCVANIT